MDKDLKQLTLMWIFITIACIGILFIDSDIIKVLLFIPAIVQILIIVNELIKNE